MKKQRYFSEQRRRLDEMRVKKEQEMQLELQHEAQIKQKEMRKKRDSQRYYSSLV